ncbi:hypothetical protein ACFXHA_43625 [Nocardia sp. NPDC059240]|uniref:hypothetical protein n=1 Tax=Nocardia sp. NPDC059240 TaxID=3346786 RepID=UPI0036A0C0F3
MTMRTIEHTQPGPVLLVLHISAGTVTVTADPEFTTAALTLAPLTDGDTTAERAAASTTVSHRGARLDVRVPATPTAPQVIGLSLPGLTITGGTVVAGTIGGHGNSGKVTLGPTGLATTSGAGLAADVRLPAGSTVRITADSAAVILDGPLADAEVVTTSGSVDITGAADVFASTDSGAIHLYVPTGGRAYARTGSGSIDITTAPDVPANALDVASRTGRIRIRPTPGPASEL